MPCCRAPLVSMLLALAAGVALGGGASVAATEVPRATSDAFDGAWAWRELRAQVALGPRPAGSAASRRLTTRLVRSLPAGRRETVAGGLTNVVGHLPGRRPAIVVAAHHDTKMLRGVRFVGANDGAAGTAAVLAIARAMAAVRRPAAAPELRFVLFDGEEAPGDGGDFFARGLRGSRGYAADHRGEVRAVVVIDLVAHRGVRLAREAGSDPSLWARLRRASAGIGLGPMFADRAAGEILDDHTPFARAGVPSIDLIDLSYRWWHTAGDTPDKLSVRSLDAVGEAVVALLRGWR